MALQRPANVSQPMDSKELSLRLEEGAKVLAAAAAKAQQFGEYPTQGQVELILADYAYVQVLMNQAQKINPQLVANTLVQQKITQYSLYRDYLEIDALEEKIMSKTNQRPSEEELAPLMKRLQSLQAKCQGNALSQLAKEIDQKIKQYHGYLLQRKKFFQMAKARFEYAGGNHNILYLTKLHAHELAERYVQLTQERRLPQDVSLLINEVAYIKAHQSIEAKALQPEMQGQLLDQIKDKQSELVATEEEIKKLQIKYKIVFDKFMMSPNDVMAKAAKQDFEVHIYFPALTRLLESQRRLMSELCKLMRNDRQVVLSELDQVFEDAYNKSRGKKQSDEKLPLSTTAQLLTAVRGNSTAEVQVITQKLERTDLHLDTSTLVNTAPRVVSPNTATTSGSISYVRAVDHSPAYSSPSGTSPESDKLPRMFSREANLTTQGSASAPVTPISSDDSTSASLHAHFGSFSGGK